MENTFLFILWYNGKYKKHYLEECLKSDFKNIRKLNINTNKDAFSELISQFYGNKLPNLRQKVKECGNGQFILYVFEDESPNYEVVKTNSGLQFVNRNVFDIKIKLRNELNIPNSIHASNNESETEYDLINLKVCVSDDRIYEEKHDGGWCSLDNMFESLNELQKYVILRNFDRYWEIGGNNLHEDIDILVENTKDAAMVLRAEPVFNKKYRRQYKVKVKGEYVLIDLREISDGYMDPYWCNDILNNRIKYKNIYVPGNINLFYSLIYHALVHKNTIADDYPKKINEILNKVKLKPVSNLSSELDGFMVNNNYKYTKPEDPTVGFNIYGKDHFLVDVKFKDPYLFIFKKYIRSKLKNYKNIMPYELKYILKYILK